MHVNQEKSAESMSKKHDHKRNKRTVTLTEGESVSVLMPRIDRGGTQLPRIPGIVKRVVDGSVLYEICIKHGVLNDCLRAGDLVTYHWIIGFNYKDIDKKITIREVSRLEAGRDKDLKDIEISCNCTG